MKRIATSKDQFFEMRLSSGFGPEDQMMPEQDQMPEQEPSESSSSSVSIPWDVANRILGLLAGYKHSKGYDAERSGMDSDTSDIDEMSEILKQAMFPEEEPYMESGGLPGWER